MTTLGPQGKFVFGLVGFIIVAALLDRFDDAHGTNYLWLYTLVIGLGLALGHKDALVKGLAGLTTQPVPSKGKA